jgi:hypothetical protein
MAGNSFVEVIANQSCKTASSIAFWAVSLSFACSSSLVLLACYGVGSGGSFSQTLPE